MRIRLVAVLSILFLVEACGRGPTSAVNIDPPLTSDRASNLIQVNYPPSAVLARIQGEVKVRTNIRNGSVSYNSTEAVSGHPLLASNARDSLLLMRFPELEDGQHEFTFIFVDDVPDGVSYDPDTRTFTIKRYFPPLFAESPSTSPDFVVSYPAIARAAMIQGDVRALVEVNADGLVTEVALLFGHPLLAPAAEEAILLTQFPEGEARTFELVFQFSIGGLDEEESVQYDADTNTVIVRTYSRSIQFESSQPAI